MTDEVLESYDPCAILDYKYFSGSTVENPKLMVFVDIGKAYVNATKVHEYGKRLEEYKATFMPTGEL